MYDYNELYETCDKVLAKFSTSKARLKLSELDRTIEGKDPSFVLSAIYQLVADRFLEQYKIHDEPDFLITGQGMSMKIKGGYRPYLIELKTKSELQESVNTSVVDTNDLVKKNVRTQQRLTVFALIIAGIAAISPTITLVKDFLSPQQLIDKDTKLQMKNTQATIHSLRQNLDSINVSLKNLKTISYKIDTTKEP